MKCAFRLTVVLAAVVLAGCDNDARRLAMEANAALEDYRKELNRQAEVERKAYRAQASVEGETRRAQAFSELEQEKIERARSLAADAIEGRWSISRWRTALREFAEADTKVRREMLSLEAERQMSLTSRLASLQLSKDRLDTLSKVLKELSENPKLLDQAKGAATFARSASTEFDKAVCASLKLQFDEQTSASNKAKLAADALSASNAPQLQIDAAAAEKKKADAAISQLKKKRADKDCDAVEKAK